MKFMKAAIIILLIPAILTVLDLFQDYADDNLTLTTLQSAVFSLFPFALVALCVIGLFAAFRRKGGDE